MFFSLNFVIMPHPPLLLLLLLMMMFGKLHSLMHAKSTGCYSTSTHTHTHTLTAASAAALAGCSRSVYVTSFNASLISAPSY